MFIHCSSDPYPRSMRPPLRPKTLQPPIQSIRKIPPTNRTARIQTLRPKIVTMLRIRHDVPEDFVTVLLIPALRRVCKLPHLGRKRLIRQRGKSAPRIEFTTTPVRVGRADVPAAEDSVGAVGVGPLGEAVFGRGGGELAVAKVFLVREGVVF
jgi:hypothetical protein